MDGRLFVFRDITKRKRAEETKLESEIRYRALFERTSDAVFILDLDLVCIAANQQAANLLGYEVDEMIGKSSKQLVKLGEWQDAQKMAEMVKLGEAPPIHERTFIRKDGSIISLAK